MLQNIHESSCLGASFAVSAVFPLFAVFAAMSAERGDKANLADSAETCEDTELEEDSIEESEDVIEEELEDMATPKKKLKVMMEAHFECAPYSSLKEYMKAKELWKMVEEDGVEEALQKREESGGFTQSLAADDMQEYYRTILQWQADGYGATKKDSGGEDSKSSCGTKEDSKSSCSTKPQA